METTYQYNTNSFLRESFLGSKYLDPDYLFGQMLHYGDYLMDIRILKVLNIVLAVLCVFFVLIIIYATIRVFEIRKKEHNHLHHEIAEYAHHLKELEKKKQGINGSKNERWSKVLEYINSASEADWKLAIIEADSILDSLMDNLGFSGENLGEKLKKVTEDNYPILSTAWEGHIVRNKIAHEGSSFVLSDREAKGIITVYENIFRQFNYI